MQVDLHEAKQKLHQAGAAKVGADITTQERRQLEEQRRQLEEQKRQIEEKVKSVDQKAKTIEEKEKTLQSLDQDLKKRKARLDQLEQQLQKVILSTLLRQVLAVIYNIMYHNVCKIIDKYSEQYIIDSTQKKKP